MNTPTFSLNRTAADLFGGKASASVQTTATAAKAAKAAKAAAVLVALAATPAAAATLHVGQGQPYRTLQAAVNAAAPGDTVAVHDGTYQNQWLTVAKPLTIEGVGGQPHVKGTVNIPNTKGMITITRGASVTLRNLEISGGKDREANGACVWVDGSLTLENSWLHDCQDGILTTGRPDGRLVVEGSTFERGGLGGWLTHCIYANGIARIEVTDSRFYDCRNGSHIQTRAHAGLIEGNTFVDGPGVGSTYHVNMPSGGAYELRGNVFYQADKGSNRTIVRIGNKGGRGGSLEVHGNTLRSGGNCPGNVGVRNDLGAPVTVQGNYAWACIGKPVLGATIGPVS